ncbi:unnamed protein product, partial [Polarella glacialis]
MPESPLTWTDHDKATWNLNPKDPAMQFARSKGEPVPPCPKCGALGKATFEHEVWECNFTKSLPDIRITSTNNLCSDAVKGVDELPCFWLRGLVPWSWTFGRASEHITDSTVFGHGPWVTGKWDLPPGACAGTDGSGGPRGNDPRMRRVGWGVVVSTFDCFTPIAWASGPADVVQTVPRAELTALLSHVDLWTKLWEDIAARPGQIVLSRTNARTGTEEIQRGVLEPWAYTMNHLADRVAGEAALKYQLPDTICDMIEWIDARAHKLQSRLIAVFQPTLEASNSSPGIEASLLPDKHLPETKQCKIKMLCELSEHCITWRSDFLKRIAKGKLPGSLKAVGSVVISRSSLRAVSPQLPSPTREPQVFDVCDFLNREWELDMNVQDSAFEGILRKLRDELNRLHKQEAVVEVCAFAQSAKEDEDQEKAKEEDETKMEVEEEEAAPRAELSEEEKGIWFRRSEHIPDVSLFQLNSTLVKFSLPAEIGENLDEVSYAWRPKAAAQEYMTKWVSAKKFDTRVEDIEPSDWFRERWRKWQLDLDDWQRKQMAFRPINFPGEKPMNGQSGPGELASLIVNDKDDLELEALAKDCVDVLQQLREEVEAQDVDLFSVEDVCDDGSGKPLFAHFGHEDWVLLSLRAELNLLVHAFKRDCQDPERTGIHPDHLPFYWA